MKIKIIETGEIVELHFYHPVSHRDYTEIVIAIYDDAFGDPATGRIGERRDEYGRVTEYEATAETVKRIQAYVDGFRATEDDISDLAIVLDVHRPAVRDYVYKAVKSCKMDERRFLSALALAELRANPSLLDEYYESRKLG